MSRVLESRRTVSRTVPEFRLLRLSNFQGQYECSVYCFSQDWHGGRSNSLLTDDVKIPALVDAFGAAGVLSVMGPDSGRRSPVLGADFSRHVSIRTTERCFG